MTDVLLIEQLGRVRRLTLNRPEKRNALNGQLLRELYDEVERAGQDTGTSVIVLRGAGKSFCAGFDISGAGSPALSPPEDDRVTYGGALEMNRIWTCPIPIIAQVHGHCLATATDIVFNCDLVIAAHDAKIGHPGVRRQGTPPTNMWLYHAGTQLAKWLMLTGASISGAEAARRGLVLSSHPAEDLDEAVLSAAHELSLVSRDVSIANKSVLNFGIELLGRSQLQRYASAQDVIAHGGADNLAFRQRVAEIGLTATLAERDAAFTGRGTA